jgi:hypothetical protein
MTMYGAETWTLRVADQQKLESLEMCCWRRMEKISWTDHVRNEEVLLRVKEQRNILHEIRKRKANWIGRSLRRKGVVGRRRTFCYNTVTVKNVKQMKVSQQTSGFGGAEVACWSLISKFNPGRSRRIFKGR